MKAGLRRGDVSLYRQVGALLREQIQDGSLRPGDRMPSEADLCGQYRVSRATVRQALDALEKDGLIERSPGRGTFLRRYTRPARCERLRQDWRALIETASKRGVLLRGGRAAPPAVVARALGLAPAEETPFTIRVLDMADRSRVAVKTYVRPDCDWLDESGRSFADVADERGAAIARGDAWIEAILAEPRFAMMLKVPLGAPLLSLWWVDQMDDAPIACSQMLMPGAGVAAGLSP